VYNKELALQLLKARMDRAGLDVPPDLLSYWESRLEYANKKLIDKGIVYDDEEKSINDNSLIADYAAWMLKNRDESGAMPKWLSLEIRERFLKGAVKNVL
jgi:hypothetical protein